MNAAGPMLVQVDSFALAGSDSLSIRKLMGFTVDSSGNLYVADGFTRHAVGFTRHGVPERVYGRPGTRAGEFQMPYAMSPVGDSLIAVDEFDGQALFLFDRRTGVYRANIPYDGFLRSLYVAGDVAWIGIRDTTTHTAFVVENIRTHQTRRAITFPPGFSQSGGFAAANDQVRFALWADTLIVAFPGYPNFMVERTSGAVLDSFSIPVSRRQGIPANVVAIAKHQTPDQRITSLSRVDAMQHRSDGSLVVVYWDVEPNTHARAIAGYVSVVTPSRQQACVDAPLTFSHDATPRVAFRGDTLFTIDQRAMSVGGGMTYVRAFVVDTRHCDWLPTHVNQRGVE